MTLLRSLERNRTTREADNKQTTLQGVGGWPDKEVFHGYPGREACVGSWDWGGAGSMLYLARRISTQPEEDQVIAESGRISGVKAL